MMFGILLVTPTRCTTRPWHRGISLGLTLVDRHIDLFFLMHAIVRSLLGRAPVAWSPPLLRGGIKQNIVPFFLFGGDVGERDVR